MKKSDALAATRERLEAAGCVAAGEEAEELHAAATDLAVLEQWVTRRERGEPLAWITGHVAFCGRTLHVEPGVFVPRAQSEPLARRAARVVPPSGRVVDLCTGIGPIAASVAAIVPSAMVVATELDERALRCARRNGVRVLQSDLDGGLTPRAFDVVTAVAPYVPTEAMRLLPGDVRDHEPVAALDGGADGLDVLRRVVRAAARLLVPGGWLFVEVGGDQDVALAAVLGGEGFEAPELCCDEDGDLRGMSAQLGPLTEPSLPDDVRA